MTDPTFTAEPGSHSMSITHELDAPPALVFRCFSEPELMAQWLGPRRLTMKVDHHDLRHGGTWRYVHVGEDGTEHAFRGCFHGEASVEAGITQTWEYEGAPGHVSLEHAAFAELPDGRTALTLTAVHQTVQARDMHLANGMEGGAREGFERMAELLARLR